MIDIREPIYRCGERVLAAVDLVNDGSHPEGPADGLLAAAGAQGEIINVGHHADSNTPVYLVEFGGCTVVGCFEEELLRAVRA